jgi:MFS family permease
MTSVALLLGLLGLLTVTHVVRLWRVFALAVALGVVNSVDQPARQTFVPEMVGRDQVQDAVSLNSVLTNASRAVGPAVAGALIATAGGRGVLPGQRSRTARRLRPLRRHSA